MKHTSYVTIYRFAVLRKNFTKEGFLIPDFIQFSDSLQLMKEYKEDVGMHQKCSTLTVKILFIYFLIISDPYMGNLKLTNCVETFDYAYNHISHNALSDAKALLHVCQSAAQGLGYRNYEQYLIDNPHRRFYFTQ